MKTESLLTVQRAQHFVADAMLAFHQQLGAAFRGDVDKVRETRRQAAYATAEAIRAARDIYQKIAEQGGDRDFVAKANEILDRAEKKVGK